MSSTELMLWVLFNLFVLGMLALDLFVFHRKYHEIKLKEALIGSIGWIVLALVFNVGIYIFQGKQPAVEFFAGYLIERSLSMDNIFVFILIFASFKVPAKYQHEVLFWGILGALVMRAVFIIGGVALINAFHWITYIFGVFLVYTGIKVCLKSDHDIHPERNPFLKLARKFLPLTNDYVDGKFFVIREGRRFATPLLVVLLVVETTDLVFALDSIPAILAVTRDPFIVYSSNVFAIFGLRALYFVLANIIHMFHYLHFGLAAILVFIGAKMLMVHVYEIPTGIALCIVVACLLLSVLLSIIFPPVKGKKSPKVH